MMRKDVPADAVKSSTVGVPLEDYLSYMSYLNLNHTLLGGTPAMRLAGESYLPREEGESTTAHSARVARTVLLNVFKRTGEKLVGEVFSKSITTDKDTPEDFKGWEENIDMNGKDLSRFLNQVFLWAMYDGAAHVLVDFPEIKTRTVDDTVQYHDEDTDEWKPYTEAVKTEKGWRPYWVFYRAENVIGWRTERKNGRTILSQLRLREMTREEEGDYGVSTVERIRVLVPGGFEIWEAIENEKTTTGAVKPHSTTGQATGPEWVKIADGASELDFIPFGTFMTGEKISAVTAKAPLEDLAYLNLTHWQSTSEQRNILRYSRFALWFGRLLNTDDQGKVAFGPSRLIIGDDENSDLKAVEISGASIEAGERDLEHLEKKMAMYGLSFLMSRSGNVTATEKALDSRENQSSLRGWALDFADFVDALMDVSGVMVGRKEGESGKSDINLEFKTFLADVEPQIINEAVRDGWLPSQLAFEEFKRRGLLKEDWEWDDVSALIEKENRDRGTFTGLGGNFLTGTQQNPV